MDEFAREWTYRTPLSTKTYPKGWAGTLPADERKAAEADGALVVQEPPILVSDNRPFEHNLELKPATTKRARKKAE